VTDAERPGDDDLDVRLSWPDHQVDDHAPARSAATDDPGGRAGKADPDDAHELRREFEAKLRRQVGQFQSLSQAASDQESRLAREVESALNRISQATTQSLQALRAEIVERQHQLEEQSAAQQVEFTRLGELGEDKLKRVFADHASELDRLLHESHREMNTVVEQHVGEIEHSMSASTAELNEVADLRFAQFDRTVTSQVAAIHDATARSLRDIDNTIEHRIRGLEERVVAWAQERQAGFSRWVDEAAKQSRLTFRFATIALVIAVIAIGIAFAVLLSR
jgi:hypothetical protein